MPTSLIARYGHANRLVLGVSDMVTADAELDRIKYLCDKIRRALLMPDWLWLRHRQSRTSVNVREMPAQRKPHFLYKHNERQDPCA